MGTTTFVTNRAHATMAEVQQAWAVLADSDATEALAELVSTLLEPLRIELQEMIVPYPSQ